jgi:hypothetical protein
MKDMEDMKPSREERRQELSRKDLERFFFMSFMSSMVHALARVGIPT